MNFVDRKCPEKPPKYDITSISLGLWRIITIGSDLKRVRVFFLQKVRFSYTFLYISIQKGGKTQRPLSGPVPGGGGAI